MQPFPACPPKPWRRRVPRPPLARRSFNEGGSLVPLIPALLLAAAAGCSEGYDADLYARHRPPRPTETTSRTLRWQEIQFWTKDPSQKEAVGFLETREVTLAGEMDPRTQYFVYDRNQRTPFGYINAVGVTHTWKRGGARGEGYWERRGEYTLENAVKTLFQRPAKTNVGFEALEYVPSED